MFTRILISALAFLLIPTNPNSLQAEILDVTITWTAIECQGKCDKLLTVQFGKIYGVATFNINEAAGQANLKWKPKVPFSFYPINTAMRMVGPHINTIRVKVKGKIQHTGGNVKIISDEDGTVFYLLNPIIPVANQFVATRSAYNRQLTPDLLAKLIDGEAKKQTATIEGPLFEPYRSPPLQIVIEHLSFEDNK